MKKLLCAMIISVTVFSGCSKDEDTPQQYECFTELCTKLVPKYGYVTRIIVFDSAVTDFPNSVSYDIVYNHDILYNQATDFSFTHKLRSEFGLNTDYTDFDSYILETGKTDDIYFSESGVTIICRCNDRIEKAKRIYKRYNTEENEIAENLY